MFSSSVCNFSSTKPMEVVGYAHSSNSLRPSHPLSVFKFSPTFSSASFISLRKQPLSLFKFGPTFSLASFISFRKQPIKSLQVPQCYCFFGYILAVWKFDFLFLMAVPSAIASSGMV
ncbi:hypothetical protein HAX54_012810 [Datura stramonium]|uniref:Uncharacterized protein n=1 Tax=Datura stramonium TaxID=4076 RepID=A0ABS8TKD5_DATST|nr:hypothetical protein [Datura stramonium]